MMDSLDAAETHGKGITTVIGLDPEDRQKSLRNTVAYQAIEEGKT